MRREEMRREKGGNVKKGEIGRREEMRKIWKS
jgi:hypothetical protein